MTIDFWLILGFVGQVLFFSRFIIQWIESEKKGRSVIPMSFWYLGVGGAALLFFYAFHNHDPVFTIGSALNFMIYIRNVVLLRSRPNTDI